MKPTNIEIVLTNRCNHKCVLCHTPLEESRAEFAPETCEKLLTWGRKAGAVGVFFGGGEPTVWDGLPAMASFAESLGYRNIRVITNGHRLADDEYLTRLTESGVNEFEISFKGHNAETHDRITQVPGSFSRTVRAVRKLVERGRFVDLAYLITADNYRNLTDAVLFFSDIGVSRFNYWLISLFDIDAGENARLLPRISDVMPHLLETLPVGELRKLDLRTGHIPPCFFPERYRRVVFDIRELALLVVTTGGKFMVEDSPYEGGVKTAACQKCRLAGRCLGLREDYLAKYGETEVCAIQ